MDELTRLEDDFRIRTRNVATKIENILNSLISLWFAQAEKIIQVIKQRTFEKKFLKGDKAWRCELLY